MAPAARLLGNGAWTAHDSTVGSWLQVDLENPRAIGAIAIQGSPLLGGTWTQSFELQYGEDPATLVSFKNKDGTTRIFKGNSDQGTIVRHDLEVLVTGRYFRVVPKLWTGHAPSLRVEFYAAGIPLESSPCMRSLGFDHGLFPLSAFSASSAINSGQPSDARLHGASAWIPSLHTDSYLEIDLGPVTLVSAVSTQGHPSKTAWTKAYTLQYSLDGNSWIHYKTKEGGPNVVLSANSDHDTVVTNRVGPLLARRLRILPVSFQGAPALRVDVRVLSSWALHRSTNRGLIASPSSSSHGLPECHSGSCYDGLCASAPGPDVLKQMEESKESSDLCSNAALAFVEARDSFASGAAAAAAVGGHAAGYCCVEDIDRAMSLIDKANKTLAQLADWTVAFNEKQTSVCVTASLSNEARKEIQGLSVPQLAHKLASMQKVVPVPSLESFDLDSNTVRQLALRFGPAGLDRIRLEAPLKEPVSVTYQQHKLTVTDATLEVQPLVNPVQAAVALSGIYAVGGHELEFYLLAGTGEGTLRVSPPKGKTFKAVDAVTALSLARPHTDWDFPGGKTLAQIMETQLVSVEIVAVKPQWVEIATKLENLPLFPWFRVSELHSVITAGGKSDNGLWSRAQLKGNADFFDAAIKLQVEVGSKESKITGTPYPSSALDVGYLLDTIGQSFMPADMDLGDVFKHFLIKQPSLTAISRKGASAAQLSAADESEDEDLVLGDDGDVMEVEDVDADVDTAVKVKPGRKLLGEETADLSEADAETLDAATREWIVRVDGEPSLFPGMKCRSELIAVSTSGVSGGTQVATAFVFSDIGIGKAINKVTGRSAPALDSFKVDSVTVVVSSSDLSLGQFSDLGTAALGEGVKAGVTVTALARFPEDCHGDVLCTVLKQKLGDVTFKITGEIRGGKYEFFAGLEESALSEAIKLTSTGLVFKGSSSSLSAGVTTTLEYELESGKTLRFRGDIMAGVGKLQGTLAMLGMWVAPFDVEQLAFGRVSLTLGVAATVPVPLPILGIEASLALGRNVVDCFGADGAAVDGPHCLHGTVAGGIDPVTPDGNYVYGKINTVTIGKILDTFVGVQAPPALYTAGFPEGLHLSVSRVEQELPAGTLLPEGIVLKGRMKCFSVDASIDLRVIPSRKLLHFEGSMDPLSWAGGRLKISALSDSSKGPSMTIRFSPEEFYFAMDGQAHLLGISAKAQVLVSERYTTGHVSGKILNLFHAVVRWQVDVTSVHRTSFDVSGEMQNDLTDAVKKEMLDVLSGVSNKAQRAYDSASSSLDSAKNSYDAVVREVKKAEDAVKAKQDKVDEWDAKIDEAKKKINSCSTKSCCRWCAGCHADNALCVAKKKAGGLALDAADEGLDAARKALKSVSDGLKSLQSRAASLRNSFDAAQRTLDKAKAAVDQQLAFARDSAGRAFDSFVIHQLSFNADLSVMERTASFHGHIRYTFKRRTYAKSIDVQLRDLKETAWNLAEDLYPGIKQLRD